MEERFYGDGRGRASSSPELGRLTTKNGYVIIGVKSAKEPPLDIPHRDYEMGDIGEQLGSKQTRK